MVTTSSMSSLSDPASISANRAGQFTSWQRQLLKPPSLLGTEIVLVLSGIVIALGAYFFLILPLSGFLRNGSGGSSGISGLSSDPVTLAFIAGFLVISLFFLFLVLRLMLLPTARQLRIKLRLRRDLATGFIDQEDGQVIFTMKSGYIPRTSRGSELYNVDGAAKVDLASGPYHFYFLPRSRRVLSAERQETFAPGGLQAGLLAALEEANGFSQAELERNRQGRTSARQQAATFYRVFILAVILAAVAIASAIYVLRSEFPALFVLVPIILIVMFLMYRRVQDLAAGRVETIEGEVERTMDNSGDGGPVYHYTIGTFRFSVSLPAYNALVPGLRYRIYYLPKTKRLVSIEPLP
jgi:hypothetical protein